MNGSKAVRLRDAIIVTAIVLNLGFFRWRAARTDDLPAAVIKSVPAQDIIGNPSNVLGEPRAQYVLVEFGDYQCPPCAQLFPEIDKLLAQHRGKLRFQFRQYPLPGHLLAFPAAMLAESARRSGRFEVVNRALYAIGPKLIKGDLSRIAIANHLQYPLPPAASARYKELETIIASDKLAAKRVPIRGTPALFLCTPDQRVLAVHNAGQVEELIR